MSSFLKFSFRGIAFEFCSTGPYCTISMLLISSWIECSAMSVISSFTIKTLISILISQMNPCPRNWQERWKFQTKDPTIFFTLWVPVLLKMSGFFQTGAFIRRNPAANEKNPGAWANHCRDRELCLVIGLAWRHFVWIANNFVTQEMHLRLAFAKHKNQMSQFGLNL